MEQNMFAEDDDVSEKEERDTAPAMDYTTPRGNRWCCTDPACQDERDTTYGMFGAADCYQLRHCARLGCHHVVQFRGAPMRCSSCKRCYCHRHAEEGLGAWHGAREWGYAEWFCPDCV